MRKVLLSATAPLVLLAGACGSGSGSGPDAGDDSGGSCAVGLDVQDESNPQYPDGFDYAGFESEILPTLKDGGCAAGSCHEAGNAHPPADGAGDGEYAVYKIWPDAKSGDASAAASCNLIKTFNHFIKKTDKNNPANSQILSNASGEIEGHPPVFAPDSAEYEAILGYLEAAAEKRDDPGDSPTQYFDQADFDTNVQPLFDDAGCTAGGPCHGNPENISALKLTQAPAAGSGDATANLEAVVSLVNLETPAESRVYLRSIQSHSNSTTMDSGQAGSLLEWIKSGADAKCNNPEGCPEDDDQPTQGCVDPEKFNAGAFENDILPMLEGDYDYNDPDGQDGIATGCARETCHGDPSLDAPGSFYIGGTPEEALSSFGCFVNLQNPAYSPLLLCPLKSSQCPKNPHPGDQIFADTDDLNYQRLLSYIFAASDAPPYDFAFFAKKINPIFSTEFDNFVCSDPNSCHGVGSPGETPPNFSDFPILAGNDIASLGYNFTQAAAFANLLNANQSPLFLYPTDQIGDLIPGVVHPPGEVLDPDSQEAQDILTWVEGLRPEANGVNRNWLVAGEYLVNDINDEPNAVDEATIEPKIFDASGGVGEDNNGEWDGLFSEADDVNLNDEFNRDQSVDRAAYAVAYIVNLSGVAFDNATITVESNDTNNVNDVKVYAGGNEAVGLDGNAATAQLDIPAFNGPDTVQRVLVKVFQPTGELGDDFVFRATFEDEDGNVIDNEEDVIFVLGPYGEGF